MILQAQGKETRRHTICLTTLFIPWPTCI